MVNECLNEIYWMCSFSRYRAPELLNDSQRYSKAIDMWSKSNEYFDLLIIEESSS